MNADEFREIALGLPGTEERSHMQHPDFRVMGKIFATLGPELDWGMVKLTPEQQLQYVELGSEMFRPASGKWGDGGATIITLANVERSIVVTALTDAWQNVTGKRSTA